MRKIIKVEDVELAVDIETSKHVRPGANDEAVAISTKWNGVTIITYQEFTENFIKDFKGDINAIINSVSLPTIFESKKKLDVNIQRVVRQALNTFGDRLKEIASSIQTKVPMTEELIIDVKIEMDSILSSLRDLCEWTPGKGPEEILAVQPSFSESGEEFFGKIALPGEFKND